AAAGAAALLTLALAPTVALYAFTHHAVARGDLLFWKWGDKALACLTPFMTYSLTTMAATTIAVIGAALIALREARWADGVRLACASLSAVFVVAPYAAGGGAFVDTRLPLMAALLLFCGPLPRLPPRVAMAIAVTFALVIVGR